jgi:hypothetical protein
MGKKRKRQETQIERIMRECNKKIRSVKFEKKKAQCDCGHKSDGGKTWLRHTGGKDSFVLKCKKCRRKVDFSPLKDKNAKEAGDYIKDTFNEAINLCDMVKINISPKADKKYSKLVSKVQFELFQLKKISKIIIADGFENKKGKNKKRHKKSGFTMAAGGSSLL